MKSTTTKLRLDGTTDELPQVLHDRFDWIIAGNQVGASWRESHCNTEPDGGDDYNDHNHNHQQHLGGPSPVNAHDCPLNLWLGVSKTSQELLVLLTLSVQLGKRGNKPRRMFLLVPVESLALGNSAADFQPLGLDQVPESLFERPHDTRSAHCNGFLHIGLVLDPAHKSTVVMPCRVYVGRPDSTALSIMDRFKSLSESPSFEIFLKFNSYAQQKLSSLCSSMTDKNGRLISYTTPVVDVRGMYPGGSDGAFDLWEAQGWVRSDKSHKRRASDHLETPPRYLPRQFAIDPPSYNDCDAAPLITATQPTPSHDKLVPPTASRQVFLPLTHETLDRPPQDCKDHVKTSATTVLSAPTTVLVAPSASPAPVDASVAAGTIALPTAPQSTAVTVPVSSHPVPMLPVPSDASPAALPAHSDSTTVSHAPVSSPIALVVSQPVVVPVAQERNLPPTLVPSSPASVPVLPSMRFFKEMSEWLLRAWEVCPLAHYRCIAHLVALAAHAKVENTEHYDRLRAACTHRLVSLITRNSPSAASPTDDPRAPAPTHEIRDLISWMLLVDPSADVNLFQSLGNLQNALQCLDAVPAALAASQ
ncbi:hypothetical protein E4T50_16600 [Aureobasidium sp. EXF-12298]|nr:hypothetical protein E4T50_16600 [Aureobasidium sp. EXF-12298]KAI4768186.1 hypothetical protein E4T52_16711 [Aureobasidium sp. EXF-3400]